MKLRSAQILSFPFCNVKVFGIGSNKEKKIIWDCAVFFAILRVIWLEKWAYFPKGLFYGIRCFSWLPCGDKLLEHLLHTLLLIYNFMIGMIDMPYFACTSDCIEDFLCTCFHCSSIKVLFSFLINKNIPLCICSLFQSGETLEHIFLLPSFGMFGQNCLGLVKNNALRPSNDDSSDEV